MKSLSVSRRTLLAAPAALIAAALLLAGCGSTNPEASTGSDSSSPVTTATAPAEEEASLFTPDAPARKVPADLGARVKELIASGESANDPRTNTPLPEALPMFMKLLNETNAYVVDAKLTDEADLVAAYKRIWDWAASAGLGLFAILSAEERAAGIKPTDPTPATILNIVTLDGTQYCAIDIRYLGEKLNPPTLIQQALLTMPCADLNAASKPKK